jgi:iron-sulfur cluster assembly accessory protein
MSCCSPHKKKEEDHSHNNSSSCCSAPKKNAEPQQSSCCSAPKKNEEQSSQKESRRVSRQMTIEDILGMFPHKAQKLSQEITNAGLHCVGCHAATWETLETGMMSHGKTNEQIDTLVERLNILLDEKIDVNTISITPRGAAKFMEIGAEDGKQGWGIRFSEEMAGCNGFEYVLDFSEKSDADDQVFTSNGIEIHVKKALLPRLIGSEIDFVDGLRGSGFKITNPNVGSSCGCGSSHGY